MNKVILMGRLTDNPVIRQTQTGIPVASFTLAVNRQFKNQQGERQADFIDIVAWRSTADFVGKYFVKGQQVAVTGSLQMRDWTDKEGKKRRNYEVVADEVFFADSKRDGAPRGDYQGGYQPQGGYSAPQGGYNQPQGGGYQQPQSQPQSGGYEQESARFETITEDDGLPF